MPKPKEITQFKKWVVAAGAEALAPTNPYELFRFSCDRGIGVIYRNSKDQETWTGAAAELYPIFKEGKSVRLAPRKARHSDKRFDTLIERDGDQCWFGCGMKMTAASATVEHLCARTHGGPDHVANLVLACRPCNSAVDHLSIAEKVAFREDQMRAARFPTGAVLQGLLS